MPEKITIEIPENITGLALNPSKIDIPFLPIGFFTKTTATFTSRADSNWQLSSAETIEGNFTLEILGNSTLLISLDKINTNKFQDFDTGIIRIIDVFGRVAFLPITVRTINPAFKVLGILLIVWIGVISTVWIVLRAVYKIKISELINEQFKRIYLSIKKVFIR